MTCYHQLVAQAAERAVMKDVEGWEVRTPNKDLLDSDVDNIVPFSVILLSVVGFLSFPDSRLSQAKARTTIRDTLRISFCSETDCYM